MPEVISYPFRCTCVVGRYRCRHVFPYFFSRIHQFNVIHALTQTRFFVFQFLIYFVDATAPRQNGRAKLVLDESIGSMMLLLLPLPMELFKILIEKWRRTQTTDWSNQFWVGNHKSGDSWRRWCRRPSVMEVGGDHNGIQTAAPNDNKKVSTRTSFVVATFTSKLIFHVYLFVSINVGTRSAVCLANFRKKNENWIRFRHQRHIYINQFNISVCEFKCDNLIANQIKIHFHRRPPSTSCIVLRQW